MVELVDTYALGAYAARCAGSNPVPGTTSQIEVAVGYFFVCLTFLEKCDMIKKLFKNFN